MNARNFTITPKYINITLRVYSGKVTRINDGVPTVVNINQWNIIILVVIYHYHWVYPKRAGVRQSHFFRQQQELTPPGTVFPTSIIRFLTTLTRLGKAQKNGEKRGKDTTKKTLERTIGTTSNNFATRFPTRKKKMKKGLVKRDLFCPVLISTPLRTNK